MNADPFASLDRESAGKVIAACGHRCDMRTLVYWHCEHGVTALCPDCGPEAPIIIGHPTNDSRGLRTCLPWRKIEPRPNCRIVRVGEPGASIMASQAPPGSGCPEWATVRIAGREVCREHADLIAAWQPYVGVPLTEERLR